MSVDKAADVGLTDFHILETDSFDQGLEFHINLQCPACESFKNNFVCCSCIQNELFITNPGISRSNIYNNNDKLTIIRNRMLDVNNRIKHYQPILFKSEGSVVNRILELKSTISSLQSTVDYLSELNRTKRRRHARLQQLITKYHSSSQQISERQVNLMRHSLAVSQRRKLLLFNLNIINNQMKQMHDSLLEELLCTHFVIELSINGLMPDKFASSLLHIDREKIFTGPEPTPSSHTALTYCSIAIRVATILLDVWLPPSIRRNLHLTGTFLSVLPQRDDLGRVYSAIIHAVHLLCKNRGIDVRNGLIQLGITLPPGRSIYNPLLGLYCLGHLVHQNNKSTRFFDEAYELKLNGFFGTVSVPAKSPYRLIAVEQGVEADASSQQQTTITDRYPNEPSRRSITDYLTTPPDGRYHVFNCNNTIITATSLNSIFTTTPSAVDDSDCWEWVSLNSVGGAENDQTLNPLDPTDTGALSTVWRLARGFMGNSTSTVDDEPKS